MIAIGFCCAGCNRDFDWDSEIPLVGAYETKTIGSRYCVGCIDKEADTHGLPRDRVIEMRKRMGRAVP